MSVLIELFLVQGYLAIVKDRSEQSFPRLSGTLSGENASHEFGPILDIQKSQALSNLGLLKRMFD